MDEPKAVIPPRGRLVALSPLILGVALIAGVALRVFYPEAHASFCGPL